MTTNRFRLLPAAAVGGFLLFSVLTTQALADKKPKSLDTSTSTVVERKRAPRPKPGPGRPTVSAARTGSLRIGPAIQGAVILVNDKPAKPDFDQAENQYVLDDLRPGRYTITYDPPDYITQERISNVKAGVEQVWTPPLKPATVPLVVSALPSSKLYVDNKYQGDTLADGTLKAEVKAGKHEIKVVKDTYEEFKQTASFDYGAPVAINARLIPVPSSAEFSDDFDINLKRWTTPATGWAIKQGKLTLSNAPELGMATGVNYRDIRAMAFYLRLDNGGGAAWAVHAKDAKNYYLFYLSGPTGVFPGKFNTYVVRDGKFDVNDPVNSVTIVDNLTRGGAYQIEMKVVGNAITHTITPADTGRPINLGAFVDKDAAFTYGGIGFRTVASEIFSVDDLYVQP